MFPLSKTINTWVCLYFSHDQGGRAAPVCTRTSDGNSIMTVNKHK